MVLDLGRARRRAPSAALPRQRLLVLIAGAGVLLGERGDGAYTMNAGGGVAMSVHVRDQPGGSAVPDGQRPRGWRDQCHPVLAVDQDAEVEATEPREVRDVAAAHGSAESADGAAGGDPARGADGVDLLGPRAEPGRVTHLVAKAEFLAPIAVLTVDRVGSYEAVAAWAEGTGRTVQPTAPRG